MAQSTLKSWIRNQVLISDESNQRCHDRHGEHWTQPGKPGLAAVSSLLHEYRTSGPGEHILALLDQHGGCAHVERTVRAIEQVFFELIELLGVQLVQQVPLGCLQTHCVAVVHLNCSPSYNK